MGLGTSKRQAALTDLLNRLSFIRKAKGYNTDAGLCVLEGEAPRFGEGDPDEAIAVFVGDDSPEASGGMTRTRVPIEIWAAVSSRLKSPLMAIEAMIADIREAIEIEQNAATDRSLGVIDGGPATLPTGLDRGPVRPLRREPGSEFVGVSVEYVARFETRWGTS